MKRSFLYVIQCVLPSLHLTTQIQQEIRHPMLLTYSTTRINHNTLNRYAQLADRKFQVLTANRDVDDRDEFSQVNLSRSPSMMTMSFTTRSASRIEESGSGISSSPQGSYRVITDVKTAKKISTSLFSNVTSDDELLDDCINVLTSWILDKSSPRPYFKSLCVSAKHALESKRARGIASKTSVQDLWTTSGVSHVLLPALIKAVE